MAIVRPPASSFARGITTSDLGPPNYQLALQQHGAYCEALEKCGLKLLRLEADEHYPDSTFVEDTAVIFRRLGKQKPAREQGLVDSFDSALPDGQASACVLTRPGALSRRGEVDRIKETFSAFFAELHSIEAPGTLDGGDVCQADDHFFIGVSERTNEAGAERLATLLLPFGCTASMVDIRGKRNLLHLKSGLAYLGDERLVVIDELADHEAFRRFELVRVNPAEQYAANCVRVNDHVLIATGYPAVEKTLRDLGYTTMALAMTEFQKMDGGLSCLSLRF